MEKADAFLYLSSKIHIHSFPHYIGCGFLHAVNASVIAVKKVHKYVLLAGWYYDFVVMKDQAISGGE